MVEGVNVLIESTLEDFEVDGIKIPVAYMFYQGHGEPYVVYMNQDKDNSLTCDDTLAGYVDYYDFDVYARGNYFEIIEELRSLLEDAGFVWQVSKSSPDMYETDTGYYHKTLNFAIFRERKE